MNNDANFVRLITTISSSQCVPSQYPPIPPPPQLTSLSTARNGFTENHCLLNPLPPPDALHSPKESIPKKNEDLDPDNRRMVSLLGRLAPDSPSPPPPKEMAESLPPPNGTSPVPEQFSSAFSKNKDFLADSQQPSFGSSSTISTVLLNPPTSSTPNSLFTTSNFTAPVGTVKENNNTLVAHQRNVGIDQKRENKGKGGKEDLDLRTKMPLPPASSSKLTTTTPAKIMKSGVAGGRSDSRLCIVDCTTTTIAKKVKEDEDDSSASGLEAPLVIVEEVEIEKPEVASVEAKKAKETYSFPTVADCEKQGDQKQVHVSAPSKVREPHLPSRESYCSLQKQQQQQSKIFSPNNNDNCSTISASSSASVPLARQQYVDPRKFVPAEQHRDACARYKSELNDARELFNQKCKELGSVKNDLIKLKKEFEELQEEKNSESRKYQSQLAELNNKNAELVKKRDSSAHLAVQTVQKELLKFEDLKKEDKRKDTEIEKLKAELSEVTLKHNEDYQRICDEVATEMAEARSLKEALEKDRLEHQKLQEENKKLRSKNENLNKMNADLSSDNIKLKEAQRRLDKLRQCRDEKIAAEMSLTAERELREAAESSRESAQQSERNLIEERDSLNAQLTAVKKNYQREKAQLEKERADANKRVDLQSTKLVRKQKRIRELKSELKEERVKREQAEEEHQLCQEESERQQQTGSLLKQLSAVKLAQRFLSQVIKNTRSELTKVEEMHSDFHREVLAKCKEECEALRIRAQDAERAQIDLKEESDKVLRLLKEEKERSARLEREAGRHSEIGFNAREDASNVASRSQSRISSGSTPVDPPAAISTASQPGTTKRQIVCVKEELSAATPNETEVHCDECKRLKNELANMEKRRNEDVSKFSQLSLEKSQLEEKIAKQQKALDLCRCSMRSSMDDNVLVPEHSITSISIPRCRSLASTNPVDPVETETSVTRKRIKTEAPEIEILDEEGECQNQGKPPNSRTNHQSRNTDLENAHLPNGRPSQKAASLHQQKGQERLFRGTIVNNTSRDQRPKSSEGTLLEQRRSPCPRFSPISSSDGLSVISEPAKSGKNTDRQKPIGVFSATDFSPLLGLKNMLSNQPPTNIQPAPAVANNNLPPNNQTTTIGQKRKILLENNNNTDSGDSTRNRTENNFRPTATFSGALQEALQSCINNTITGDHASNHNTTSSKEARMLGVLDRRLRGEQTMEDSRWYWQLSPDIRTGFDEFCILALQKQSLREQQQQEQHPSKPLQNPGQNAPFGGVQNQNHQILNPSSYNAASATAFAQDGGVLHGGGGVLLHPGVPFQPQSNQQSYLENTTGPQHFITAGTLNNSATSTNTPSPLLLNNNNILLNRTIISNSNNNFVASVNYGTNVGGGSSSSTSQIPYPYIQQQQQFLCQLQNPSVVPQPPFFPPTTLPLNTSSLMTAQFVQQQQQLIHQQQQSNRINSAASSLTIPQQMHCNTGINN